MTWMPNVPEIFHACGPGWFTGPFLNGSDDKHASLSFALELVSLHKHAENSTQNMLHGLTEPCMSDTAPLFRCTAKLKVLGTGVLKAALTITALQSLPHVMTIHWKDPAFPLVFLGRT